MIACLSDEYYAYIHELGSELILNLGGVNRMFEQTLPEMKYKLLYRLATCFILWLVPELAYTQVCGNGINFFHFYVPNGHKAVEIHYQIYPEIEHHEFDSLVMNSKLSDYKKKKFRGNTHNGVIMDPDYIDIEPFLRQKPKPKSWPELGWQENPMTQWREDSRWPLFISGMTKTGFLKFPTWELGSSLYVIQFTIEGKSLYWLGPLFGGCGKQVDFVWNGHYFERTEWW